MGERHEELVIREGDRHSYPSIFGKVLDSKVTWITIEDAYIRERHQISNLKRFLNIAKLKSPSLKRVILTTKLAPEEGEVKQREGLLEAVACFKDMLELNVYFKDTLHDRKIEFSNGWKVKLGRGLDIFQPAHGRIRDHDSRPCKETTIDFFYKPVPAIRNLHNSENLYKIHYDPAKDGQAVCVRPSNDASRNHGSTNVVANRRVVLDPRVAQVRPDRRHNPPRRPPPSSSRSSSNRRYPEVYELEDYNDCRCCTIM